MIDESDLVAQFEACTLPIEHWHHRQHLTVAWYYLTHHEFNDAIVRMRTGVQRYNQVNNVPEGIDQGYHETLTQAWLHIMHGIISSRGAETSAAAFLDEHPYLLGKFLLRMFYTPERIMTLEAKESFVEPDITAFPSALSS